MSPVGRQDVRELIRAWPPSRLSRPQSVGRTASSRVESTVRVRAGGWFGRRGVVFATVVVRCRPEGRGLSVLVPAVCQVRLGLALVVGGALFASPLSASAAQTLTVSAGAESPGGDVPLNAFAPNQISVNVGDTVTWKLDSTEFHNVIFTVAPRRPASSPAARMAYSPIRLLLSRLVATAMTGPVSLAVACSTRAMPSV